MKVRSTRAAPGADSAGPSWGAASERLQRPPRLTWTVNYLTTCGFSGGKSWRFYDFSGAAIQSQRRFEARPTGVFSSLGEGIRLLRNSPTCDDTLRLCGPRTAPRLHLEM